MRDASNMPELQHNGGAGDMHGLGHAFPAFDLVGAVNSGSRNIALTFRCDLCRLGNDEARARTLSIVKGVQLRRHVAGPGAAAGQGGHDSTVLKSKWAHLGATKEIWHLAYLTFL